MLLVYVVLGGFALFCKIEDDLQVVGRFLYGIVGCDPTLYFCNLLQLLFGLLGVVPEVRVVRFLFLFL